MKIAIIGSGISGNAAACALHRAGHELTVYEAESWVGGHSHTVDVKFSDGHVQPVDTGFIVYNEHNYPNMVALFNYIGVETIASDMSFAFSLDAGAYEWCGSDQIWRLFAQPSNFLRGRFWHMLCDIVRFNYYTPKALRSGVLDGISLEDYLNQNRYSAAFRDHYLIPMGAAIWSTPAQEMLKFPAKNFAIFFNNHRLMSFKRPQWRTVKGGSRAYVEKLIAPLVEEGKVRLNCAVVAVYRNENGVVVQDSHGNTGIYDRVIFATHTDQALKILKDASPVEQAILGAIEYNDNQVYLHSDPRLMPKRRQVWAAWNFLKNYGETGNSIALTYWMNILQQIPEKYQLYVSLNPPYPPKSELTHGIYTYAHPQFTANAFAAQTSVAKIQGTGGVYFCGAWSRYGFHEDGLVSGLRIAKELGAELPWEFVDGDAGKVY